MKNTLTLFIAALMILFGCATPKQSEVSEEQKSYESIISFDNEQFTLGVDLAGGAFRAFSLKEKPLNPFTWTLLESQMPENNRPYTFDGHFLCTGRWGEPSIGEMKVGIPHNGEVNTQHWEQQPVIEADGFKRITMTVKAPIEKLDVKREIMIPTEGNYFKVKEYFTNGLPIGRLSNIVQHGTIAAPFLTAKTIINTNATKGFDQRTGFQFLEDSSFTWPKGMMADGAELDLRTVTADQDYVTTHIFEEPIGWITALNPDENILMGYVWQTSEYPWLNVWHHSQDGKPFVQGLEFGTTGLGQPYQLLIDNDVSFFGRHSFEFIDANETKEKSWICFMVKVPQGFEDAKLFYASDKLTITNGSEDVVLPIQGF